ncbi:MAG TPA: ABC transporter ATP-binding protein, partial [Gemmatimonadales bacterium]|nr:ABC transporter ATP-binding protein [Gemmatimonadales bacterium]
KEYLRDYLRWLWPHRWATLGVFVLAVSAAAVDMVSPLFMRTIIDKVLLVTGVAPAERLSRLHWIGGAFLVAVILNGLLGAWKDYRQRILNVKVILALRRALFRRLLHLPLPRLWEMKTGGILSRLTGDVETTTGLLQMAIVSPAISLIRLIIAIGILTALNWRLALMALAVVPGVIVVSFIATRRIRPIYRAVRKDVEEIDGRVGETFGGIRVVRAFRRELWELFGYLRGRHTVLRKELFAHRRELVIWTTWGLLVGAVNVVIVWYGGWLNIQGRATVGDIMAFQWYTFLLLNPIWNLVNTFSELQRSLAAMERVFEVLGWEDEKPDRPGAADAPARVEELRFEAVTFEYREGRPVVQDFDVTVPGGAVVALVGRSGAGKTTVTDLVARFHDPTAGRILLNGTDLRDLKLASYRGLLAMVQQEVFLFDGSVRENIAYGGVGEITDAMVEDAARRANAHEFITHLPDGYDTLIGERGVKLSGGQRQRLAIARAILAAPAILILDEATSNLDSESERLIQASMKELLRGRTTFVIAHRLSTVRDADLIVVLDHGKIRELGSHAELMKQRGTYRAMVELQLERPEAEREGAMDWSLASGAR